MNYSLLIVLGAVLISTACFADAQPELKKGPALAAESGVIAGAPAALRLRIVPNGFQLNWMLSTHDPGVVTGYEIVRSDRFSGPYDPVATVEQGTFQYTDTTALQEIVYYYKVRAFAGKDYSLFSNTVAGER